MTGEALDQNHNLCFKRRVALPLCHRGFRVEKNNNSKQLKFESFSGANCFRKVNHEGEGS